MDQHGTTSNLPVGPIGPAGPVGTSDPPGPQGIEPRAPLLPCRTISFQIPEGDSPEAIRERIKVFKAVTERAYMGLAKDLFNCFHRKLYIGYGFSTFDDYVASEVGISKDRSYKLRRIFSVLVLKCNIPPTEVEKAERTRVEMILGVVNRENARGWLSDAKTMPYKRLRNKLAVERAERQPKTPNATKPDRPDTTTPVRLACESPRASSEGATEYVTRTFRLPTDADTLLDEGLGIAQRVTKSHSENFNLACIIQQFLAHNLTLEGKDDGRKGYFTRWMEEIYGGRFIHIQTDEAWEVLADAVKSRPDLFGTGEREESNVTDRYDGSTSDRSEDNDRQHGRGDCDQKEEEGP